MDKNNHHIFYPSSIWSKTWAKALYEHPYANVLISDTESKEIHEWISKIPVPSERVCKEVFKKIDKLYKKGKIQLVDSPSDRLKVFIYLFRLKATSTALGLREQRKIAYKHEFDEFFGRF